MDTRSAMANHYQDHPPNGLWDLGDGFQERHYPGTGYNRSPAQQAQQEIRGIHRRYVAGSESGFIDPRLLDKRGNRSNTAAADKSFEWPQCVPRNVFEMPLGAAHRSTLWADDRDPQDPRSAIGIEDPHNDNDDDEEDWTYVIEVTPALDEPGQKLAADHTAAIHEHLKSRSVNYVLTVAAPVEGSGLCRQFALRKQDRSNNRVRLEFLKAFSPSRRYNKEFPHYYFKMSVVFKDRVVLPAGPYPSGIDGRHDQEGENRFSPGPSMNGLVGYGAGDDQLLLPASPSSNGLDSPSPFDRPISPPESLSTPGHRHTRPPRLGPVIKPNRVATKNRDGKFVCSFPGCTDEVKVFGRKCEWSKHMDKHDRPYKCLAPGCEKLAGFTYSGGLLRHEREVHNKHGGPKNPLNCPHGNCKRHEGKGFSRMENLNEHLRRVHTPSEATTGAAVAQSPEAELDENPGPLQQAVAGQKIGEKRKPEDDLREEVKRLHQENQKLRDQILAQSINSMAMMQTIGQINARLAQLTNGGPNPQDQAHAQAEVQVQAQAPQAELQPVAQHQGQPAAALPQAAPEPDLGGPHAAAARTANLNQTLPD
ncbi:hypothetical protein F4811DRAFT_235659 [Daldinia bambusicola]|nr:hypothetical protein F4811DRAFT_235659 [Daldinia bambusicola]